MVKPVKPTPPEANATQKAESGTPPREQVDSLVAASARTHGHLCPGQVVGVRMSIAGLGLLGYPCPLPYPEIKQVMGVVEVERCLADAVASATGLRFGRGSLKLVNLGLLAASFYDMSSGRGVRLLSVDSARDLAAKYAPGQDGQREQQIEAYKIMPDAELFHASWVRFHVDDFELPGHRPEKVPCQKCGVLIRSGQVRHMAGQNLCAVCAGQAYFDELETVDFDGI